MSTDIRPSARGRTGSRRDDDARMAVLRAADDLLTEQGFAKTTVEGIARRAGVAKQTVYRWWPSKTDILLDGLIEGMAKYLGIGAAGVPLSAERFLAYLQQFQRFVNASDDGEVFLALLGHAQHDASFANLFETRVVAPLEARARELIRADEPSVSDDRINELIDQGLGAVVFRAMTHGPAGMR